MTTVAIGGSFALANGPGLPGVAKSVFTRFTTTKENGLDLVIAHDIVRKLGGKLNLETLEGRCRIPSKLKKVLL